MMEALMGMMDRNIAGELAALIAAEEADFLWEARQAERWLGGWEGCDDGEELDRIGIIGSLGGAWFSAILLVDGEGRAQGLLARHDAAGESIARARWEAG
ncbi:hypothetical protein [Sphingobium sp. CFD-1]|uniref:hypothetical protein n=1 Tax=Sphingobium sp. CFD-1 TaxID=2878545 RepID=UPI00214AC444|nr:hypothetical protein [Sphingobium sp. CFD-1]